MWNHPKFNAVSIDWRLERLYLARRRRMPAPRDPKAVSLRDMVAGFERQVLEAALIANDHDPQRAAQALGIRQAALAWRMRKLGIPSRRRGSVRGAGSGGGAAAFAASNEENTNGGEKR